MDRKCVPGHQNHGMNVPKFVLVEPDDVDLNKSVQGLFRDRFPDLKYIKELGLVEITIRKGKDGGLTRQRIIKVNPGKKQKRKNKKVAIHITKEETKHKKQGDKEKGGKRSFALIVATKCSGFCWGIGFEQGQEGQVRKIDESEAPQLEKEEEDANPPTKY
ncbi:hypothetical protein GWI33_008619 [Rhynchophorus ferrugineus]|uniref:Uncharacterized protein n=1 Tax=Rhynchophorus ferrugineus TaxID=354439 RepID=A0A834MC43_RHYFE|nr:hypothetical protein GWI33_008619 [Rhynchophorus ferrugineus]